jgi:hypothetical protein
MKKLMIASAAAVLIGGAFADAQVYEYKLSIKTTKCAEGKVAAKSYYEKVWGMEKGDEIAYRTSASITLNGLSWGCQCDTALKGEWVDRELSNGVTVWDGVTFWNKKADAFLGGAYNASLIEWDMMNRMGKKADEVEMAFKIVADTGVTGEDFELSCAGFGKIKDVSLNDNNPNCVDEYSYIASAKGNLAGYMNPESGACYYCDELLCEVYDFCECLGLMDADKTVACGTWTMKYNAAASKKLSKAGKITAAYTAFPKNLKQALVNAGE